MLLSLLLLSLVPLLDLLNHYISCTPVLCYQSLSRGLPLLFGVTLSIANSVVIVTLCWYYAGWMGRWMDGWTEAWHICSTPSCTGSMFRSKSSISSEWQFTGVSKARLPSTSWTAATPRRTLPVASDFDFTAATISSYHDIVAARSAVRRFPSPVRWPGMRCLTTSETRRSVPTISGRR